MNWPERMYVQAAEDRLVEVTWPELGPETAEEAAAPELEKAAEFTTLVGKLGLNDRPRRIGLLLLELSRLARELRGSREASRRGAIALYWLTEKRAYELLLDQTGGRAFANATEFQEAFAAKAGLASSRGRLSELRRAAGLMLQLEAQLPGPVPLGRVEALVRLPEPTAVAVGLALAADTPDQTLPSSVALRDVVRKLHHQGEAIPSGDFHARRRRVLYEALLVTEEIQGLLGRENLSPADRAAEPAALREALDKLKEILSGQADRISDTFSSFRQGPFALTRQAEVLTLALDESATAEQQSAVASFVEPQGWKPGANSRTWEFRGSRGVKAVRERQFATTLTRTKFLLELLAGKAPPVAE